MAITFLLWLQSFVRSSGQSTSNVHIFDRIPMSKLKTLLIRIGHSSPHLQVPSVVRYLAMSMGDFNGTLLGLK